MTALACHRLVVFGREHAHVSVRRLHFSGQDKLLVVHGQD